ncbi:MAG: hypothetical protein R6V06_02495 [Kiritimatiellia bacterium]
MNLLKKILAGDGFSLMEVNMAVFVLSVGILGMIALYPLGLRESMQGQADIKQTMFADYMLNQAVAIASQKNITWDQWSSVSELAPGQWPSFFKDDPSLFEKDPEWSDAPSLGKRYEVTCALVPGLSDRIMGIMIQSTDKTKNYQNYTNNPIFYAEVMFQGRVLQD